MCSVYTCHVIYKVHYGRGPSVLEPLWIHDGTCWAQRAVVTHEVAAQSHEVRTPAGHVF